MVSCGIIMKSALLAIVLVALTKSGSAAEKLASCCTKVTNEEITDPISGYLVQRTPVPPCVKAVIFQTENGLFCAYARAPWVGRKIRAFEKAKREATSLSPVTQSGVSLLSIITSTASPSSSSARLSTSSLPSFSTPEMAVSDNFSEDKE